MKKNYITWNEIFDLLDKIDNPGVIVYGVPKGGMILTAFLRQAKVTYKPEFADIILDDIIDSGKTMDYYKQKFPNKDFVGLIGKSENEWIVFPWERDHPVEEETVNQNIIRLLQYVGEDPEREGLKNTPNRIIRSYDELFSGYDKNSEEIFTTFESGTYDQMVLLKDIELFSMCEHHMLPFFGKAHVAYIPGERVIGISKLARLLDIYARRLQIQERIGEQVAGDLMNYLEPKGAACIIEANHLCMRMRGVSKQESLMVTSSLKGEFLDNAEARMELMNMIK